MVLQEGGEAGPSGGKELRKGGKGAPKKGAGLASPLPLPPISLVLIVNKNDK